MELKEFVRAAIVDVVEAVKEAQNYVGDVATVMPVMPDGNKVECVITKDGYTRTTRIDFDIAVTTANSEGVDNGLSGGINIAGFLNVCGKAKERAEESQQSVSRIKFSVDVMLPHATCPDEVVMHTMGGIPTPVARKNIPSQKP